MGFVLLTTDYKKTSGTIGREDDKNFRQITIPERGDTESYSTGPVTFYIKAPLKVGIHNYRACLWIIHKDTEEENRANNCSESVPVTVTLPPSVSFDLLPEFNTDVRVVRKRNQVLKLAVALKNQGRETSTPAALYYYRSTDRTISSEDSQLGEPISVGTIPAGDTISHNIGVTPTAAGEHFYGACIVAAGETIEINNCSVGVPVALKKYRDPS